MAIKQDSSHPTGVVDTSPRGSSAGHRARERKAFAALELKARNYSWEEIAESLGYPSARHALVATEQALEAGVLTPESQEFMRQLAGRRLEEMLYTLRGDATDSTSPDRFTAIKESRGLIETHMRLFGYAAPAEVAIYNPLETEVQEFVSAVMKSKAQGKQLLESDIFDEDPFADDDGDEPAALPSGEEVHAITSVPAREPEPEPEPATNDLGDF